MGGGYGGGHSFPENKKAPDKMPRALLFYMVIPPGIEPEFPA